MSRHVKEVAQTDISRWFSRKLLLVSAGLILVAALGRLVYGGLQSQTAVSSDEALARFRAKAEQSAQDPNEPSSPEDTEAGADSPSDQTQPTIRSAASKENSATNPGAIICEVTTFAPPEAGAYQWRTEGFEEVPGLRREMPPESHALVTHKGSDRWVEHHIYSEERERWLELIGSTAGVSIASIRNRVAIGPFTFDNTVAPEPPPLVHRFPYVLGDAWAGGWSGKTSGTYQARMIEHTTMRIGEETVEVCATEVEMHMEGEVEGDVTIRTWATPRYRIVVREHQIAIIRNGPATYRSDWVSTLLSLRPQR